MLETCWHPEGTPEVMPEDVPEGIPEARHAGRHPAKHVGSKKERKASARKAHGRPTEDISPGRSGRHPPGRPTEDISGRQPGRQIASSIFSIVMKAPHETIHLALVTIG